MVKCLQENEQKSKNTYFNLPDRKNQFSYLKKENKLSDENFKEEIYESISKFGRKY